MQPAPGLPPGAVGRDPGGTEPPDSVLGRLVEGARTGSYTLPERILDLHRAGRLLRDPHLPAPLQFGRDEAAARLVDAAMAGRPLDPMGLCADIHRFRTDRLLHSDALGLLTTAARRAEQAAVREAAQACDALVAEHLRPAYAEVLARAADVARTLAPYIDDRFLPDTPRVMTASRRVRKAYLALPALVRRHSLILAAREWANALGERTPEWDRRGLFSVLEDPFALVAGTAAGRPYDDIPEPPVPDDDTARLLWLVSDEGRAGKPWLPSVAEQDAACRMHVGRHVPVQSPATAGRGAR